MGLFAHAGNDRLRRVARQRARFVDEVRLVEIAHAQSGIERPHAGIEGQHAHGVAKPGNTRKLLGAEAKGIGELAPEVAPRPARLLGQGVNGGTRSVIQLVQQGIEAMSAAVLILAQACQEELVEGSGAHVRIVRLCQLVGQAFGAVAPDRASWQVLVMEMGQWLRAEVAQAAAAKAHSDESRRPVFLQGDGTRAQAQ